MDLAFSRPPLPNACPYTPAAAPLCLPEPTPRENLQQQVGPTCDSCASNRSPWSMGHSTRLASPSPSPPRDVRSARAAAPHRTRASRLAGSSGAAPRAVPAECRSTATTLQRGLIRRIFLVVVRCTQQSDAVADGAEARVPRIQAGAPSARLFVYTKRRLLRRRHNGIATSNFECISCLPPQKRMRSKMVCLPL